jgi:hypothetical protein
VSAVDNLPSIKGENLGEKEKVKMIRMKAMVLIAVLSLSVLSSLVSASSGNGNRSAATVQLRATGDVVGSGASSRLAGVSADQVLPIPLSAVTEFNTVGGISCASVLGLGVGLLIGGLFTVNPLLIGAGGTLVVAASGCQD